MAVTVKTASVTYGRKFNLGDYNSATIDCTLWADISEEQDLDAAMAALWTMAKENVRAQALPLVNKSKAQVEQVFMGLPLELQAAAFSAPSSDDEYDRLRGECVCAVQSNLNVWPVLPHPECPVHGAGIKPIL